MTGAMAYVRNLGERAFRAVRGTGLLVRFSVLSLACLAVLGGYLARATAKRVISSASSAA